MSDHPQLKTRPGTPLRKIAGAANLIIYLPAIPHIAAQMGPRLFQQLKDLLTAGPSRSGPPLDEVAFSFLALSSLLPMGVICYLAFHSLFRGALPFTDVALKWMAQISIVLSIVVMLYMFMPTSNAIQTWVPNQLLQGILAFLLVFGALPVWLLSLLMFSTGTPAEEEDAPL